MKYSIHIFLILLMPGWLQGQEVSAVADRDTILIGEQFKLTLKVASLNSAVSWPELDSIPGFEIISASKPDTSESSSGISITQQLVLTSWDSGSLKIPPIRIGRYSTRPLNIEVGYLPLDPNKDYNDIKDIILVQRPNDPKWYWYIIFGLVLAGLFLLFFPKMKKQEVVAELPPEKAYDAAMIKLQKLKEAGNKEEKAYYTELVHIFREYLQRKKGIQSHSKTTDDLVEPVRALQLPREQLENLVVSLQVSDMVKFAKYQSQEQEKNEAFHNIRETIEYIERNHHAV